MDQLYPLEHSHSVRKMVREGCAKIAQGTAADGGAPGVSGCGSQAASKSPAGRG